MVCSTAPISSFDRQILTERKVRSNSSASIVPPPLLSNRSNTSRKAETNAVKIGFYIELHGELKHIEYTL